MIEMKLLYCHVINYVTGVISLPDSCIFWQFQTNEKAKHAEKQSSFHGVTSVPMDPSLQEAYEKIKDNPVKPNSAFLSIKHRKYTQN